MSVESGGKVEWASDDASIKIDEMRAEDWQGGSSAINNHSEVTWKLELGPRETKTVTYTVGYYVR